MRVKLFKKLRGQSTLEYIIVLTAIIGVILWAGYKFFASTAEKSGAIEQSLQKSEDAIGRAAERFLDY